MRVCLYTHAGTKDMICWALAAFLIEFISTGVEPDPDKFVPEPDDTLESSANAVVAQVCQNLDDGSACFNNGIHREANARVNLFCCWALNRNILLCL